MDAGIPTLLFVFDAEGGLFDRLVHCLRKKLGLLKRECHLSRLTRKAILAQPAWSAFTRALSLPVRYLHREEFRGHYQAMSDVELPAVFFCYEDDSLELAIDADQIEACGALDDLQHLVRDRVAAFHRAQDI